MPVSLKQSLSLRFPHQNPAHASPHRHTRHMPTHPIILYFITRTIVGEGYRSLNSSLCSSDGSRSSLKMADNCRNT
jgi:hypothetical protein